MVIALIDFILNLAGLLLWVNWLSLRFDPLAKTSAASLVGTLRKTGQTSPRRWKSLAGVCVIILGRALVYWQVGPGLNWSPKLDLVVTDLAFRVDFLRHMLLFSLLSFGLALAAFYLWLLLLSVVNTGVPDADPLQKLVRIHFRWLERWPNPVKLLLPLLLGALFWLALHPVLVRLNIVPRTKSYAQLFEQAAVIGAGVYLTWKYLIVGVLLLHLLNSYVYLGNHPAWLFINATARNLLYPLRWLPLRAGRLDFLPVVEIALVLFIAEFFSHPPAALRPWFYRHLPF